MGLFDKLMGNNTKKEDAVSSRDIINLMLSNADIYMVQGDYERAVDTFKKIIDLQPNTTAQYNLASLYAQGKGTEQSFLEGAYWFHQAYLSGDEQAGQMCTKCMMDYAHQNLDNKTPQIIFDEMFRFAAYLYPGKTVLQLQSAISIIWQRIILITRNIERQPSSSVQQLSLEMMGILRIIWLFFIMQVPVWRKTILFLCIGLIGRLTTTVKRQNRIETAFLMPIRIILPQKNFMI